MPYRRPAKRKKPRPEDAATIKRLRDKISSLRTEKRKILDNHPKKYQKRVEREKKKWPIKRYLGSVGLIQKNFNYYYALMGYPITMLWLKKNDITPVMGMTLIIASYREIIHVWEIKAWFIGHFRASIKKLEDLGYLQKVNVSSGNSRTKRAYVLTPKAKLLIEEYHTFFDEYMEKNKNVTIFNSREHVVVENNKKVVRKYRIPKELIDGKTGNRSTQPDSTAKGV